MDTSHFLRQLKLNNSVTSSGKPVGFEESLNRMVKALGITMIDVQKGRPRKMES